MLDKRNLRTPNGRHIVKFTSAQRPLAYLTAAEWEAQTESLKSHSLPLVSCWVWMVVIVDRWK